MAAVFPALEPKHKGAAISVYNLSAGLSNFLAPAIAVVLLPYFGTIGVVIAYTTLYVIAFIICPFIRVEQPGFSNQQVCEGRPPPFPDDDKPGVVPGFIARNNV